MGSVSLSPLPSTGPYSKVALRGLYSHIFLAGYSSALAPSRFAPGDLRPCSELLTERQKRDFCKPRSLQRSHSYYASMGIERPLGSDFPLTSVFGTIQISKELTDGIEIYRQVGSEEVFTLWKNIFSLRFQAPLPGTDSNTRENPVPCLPAS